MSSAIGMVGSIFSGASTQAQSRAIDDSLQQFSLQNRAMQAEDAKRAMLDDTYNKRMNHGIEQGKAIRY